MLWEIWQSATTCVPNPVRKLGYLYEAIAMAQRAKRCQPQWQSHYKQCQNQILTAISQLVSESNTVKDVWVLGAGSLQDLPLADLSKTFKRVFLVDLVFLRSAEKQIRPYANVFLVRADISRRLEQVYLHKKSRLQPNASELVHSEIGLDAEEFLSSLLAQNAHYAQLCQRKPIGPVPTQVCAHDVSLIVSMNVATQLPLIPVRWLKNHTDFADDTLHKFAEVLLTDHLSILQAFPQSTLKLLVADRVLFDKAIALSFSSSSSAMSLSSEALPASPASSAENSEAETKEIDETDPWWGLTPPKADVCWDWHIIPKAESAGKQEQTNRVGASFYR